MPYRKLCNDVQREGAKLSPDVVSGLFCFVPLHKIRSGINLGQSTIVFAAGDDILFKAEFDESTLQELKQIYQQKTSGLTCSIEYGKSFREVYLALKLAKLESGKNSIVGVELT